MQKVVIIGCGWLGQQLGVELAAKGFSVFGSRQSAAGLAELPAVIQPVLLQLPVTTADASFMAILADSWLICAIPPAARQQSAIQYAAQLQNLVDLASAAGVRGLIHCASTGVYQGLSGDVDEHSQVQQSGRAGQLLAAEQILQQLPNCITLRLAGLIGPGRNPARFGQGRALAGPDLPVNLVHAMDIGRFVLMLLQRPAAQSIANQPEIYNLCCPDHPRKADFYQTAAAQAGLAAVTFTAAEEPERRVLSWYSQQQGDFKYQFESPFQALRFC
jgi:nucleoside-diphosphate-sugar epimerase